MSVITNHTIVNFFDKEENEDIKKKHWHISFKFQQSSY